MMRIRVGMPQMAVRGLSENWLFRDAGAAHWDALCDSMDVPSDKLVDTMGRRVYSSFVVIRARYDGALTAVGENDVFTVDGTLSRYGQAVFHSLRRYRGPIGTLTLDMTTKFVARSKEGTNDLVQTTVRPDTPSDAPELDDPPAMTAKHRMLRGGSPTVWMLDSGSVQAGDADLGSAAYAPNPYTDYNGAGLLYFASYPTIADVVERRLVHDGGLSPVSGDWAVTAGTVEREVYYFGNLNLGSSIRGTLNGFQMVRSEEDLMAVTHVTLEDAETKRRLAEIFTAKKIAEQ